MLHEYVSLSNHVYQQVRIYCCCVLLRQRIEWGWLRSGRHTKSDRSNVRCTFFARQKRKTGGGPSLFSRIRQITTTIIYISAHIPCVSRVEFTMYHLGSAHEIITAVQSPESPAVGNQKKQRADRELCRQVKTFVYFKSNEKNTKNQHEMQQHCIKCTCT